MTPSLSDALRTETRDLHTQAERSPFMRMLLRGSMSRAGYAALLRNLHAIYAALESALNQHANDPRLAPLLLAGLPREARLEHDLDALAGTDWRDTIALQSSAVRYVARLHLIEDAHPELLAAHSYVRYLGDLSGGQILGRIVRESLALPTGVGTAFYEFGDPSETARLKTAYRAGLGALAPDAATQHAIVGEARLAFELHRKLFDELARYFPSRSVSC